MSLIASLFFGKIAVYGYAGQQLGGQFGIHALQKPLLALLGGTLLFFLLYTVPVLGLLVWSALAPLAVGAVVLTTVKKFRSNGGGPAAASTASVVMSPAGVSGDVSTPEPANVLILPRVGFWLRFLAALLDAALVALIVGRLLGWSKGIVPLFFIYHIAMWTWKGTTIGGLVFGLKIVRMDGRPINFAVAVVTGTGRIPLSRGIVPRIFLGRLESGKTIVARHDRGHGHREVSAGNVGAVRVTARTAEIAMRRSRNQIGITTDGTDITDKANSSFPHP